MVTPFGEISEIPGKVGKEGKNPRKRKVKANRLTPKFSSNRFHRILINYIILKGDICKQAKKRAARRFLSPFF
jgi:hypothetical protein